MSELALARARLKSNEPQWEAFLNGGHTLVIAPPGSGKTELLTARLAQDFVEAIPSPQGAACITYSHAAADELRFRLRRLGVPRRSNLFVGTVHSFAWTQIVRPFASVVGRRADAEARVATSEQTSEAFEIARQEVFGDEHPYGLESTFQRRRRSTFLPNLDDARFGGERDAQLAAAYAEQLKAEGLVDFDDMVRIAVELAQDHKFVRSALAAMFPKLYIDEYQDLGPGLHALVKTLCFDESSNSTLFAVADPNQCIYVFSGADPALLREVEQRFDVRTINLRRNYRSGEVISQAAAGLVDGGIDYENENEGGNVEVHKIDGRLQGQAQAVAAMIHELPESVLPERVAVVCLSNADCETVADVLIDAGLPVFVRRRGEYPRTQATGFVESCADWALSSLGESGVRLADILDEWRQLLGPSSDRSRDIALAGLLLRARDPQQSAAEFVSNIAELGLVDALERNPARTEDAEALRELIDSTTSGILQTMIVAELGDRAFARNRIHVITMHSCKGLEFDLVYAVGLEFTRLPRYKSAPWEVLQQRRQFYVTVTRARDGVHLLYTGWTINRFGRRWDHGPSPFLAELDRD